MMSQTIEKMTKKDLEEFIEKKLIELLQDPDEDLELREEFKEKIKQRLNSKDDDLLTQEEVAEELG